MEWREISVQTSPQAMELVASIFEDLGAAGAVIEDPALVNEYIRSGVWDYTDIPWQRETGVVTVKAYFAADGRLDDRRQALRERLLALTENGVDTAPATVSETALADEDWPESWKKYFHTEKVGERVVIQPSWEAYEPQAGEIVVRLDPGAAFGTGTHPTTTLCLRAMEKLVRPGMTVFDIGTGSGVLAITAAKLGAGAVTAVDYDSTALRVARENIAQNGLADAITLKESDILRNVTGRADVVTANIIADIIIRIFADLDAHLAPGGALLASGIIASRAEDVRQAGKAYGFVVTEEWEAKDWAAMIFRRANEA